MSWKFPWNVASSMEGHGKFHGIPWGATEMIWHPNDTSRGIPSNLAWSSMARHGVSWYTSWDPMGDSMGFYIIAPSVAFMAPHGISWSTTGSSVGHCDVSWHAMGPHGRFVGSLQEISILMYAVASFMGCRGKFHGVLWQVQLRHITVKIPWHTVGCHGVSWEVSWDAMEYTR